MLVELDLTVDVIQVAKIARAHHLSDPYIIFIICYSNPS